MAANFLGNCYMSGTNGVKKSNKMALEWIRKSVDAGCAEGLNSLGTYHVMGKGGIERDVVKGAECFLAAAEKGSYAAFVNMSRAYARGLGVAKDPAKAAYWAKQMADYDLSCNEGLLAEARIVLVCCARSSSKCSSGRVHLNLF